MRKIVGLFGFYGSGKDEAVKALIEQGWKRVAFADPVREMALAIDPIVDAHPRVSASTGGDSAEFEPEKVRLSAMVELHGWPKAKLHPEVRRLLQHIGTDAVRKIIGPNTWVEIASRKIVENDNVVFTDLRFPNEVDLIRKYSGLIIRIDRPGNAPAQMHVSETYPFAPDCAITNDGSVAELHERILRVVDNFWSADLQTSFTSTH